MSEGPPVSAADLDEVTTLLSLAGLPASLDERGALAAGTPLRREQVRSLWAVAETRYVEPAVVFAAAPGLVIWGTEERGDA